MAIAIIPVNEDPRGSRENWLSMSQADDMFCAIIGEEPSPTDFIDGWFNSFWYFDWIKTKSRSIDNFSVSFETKKDAEGWYLQFVDIEFYLNWVEPYVKMTYDSGYKIVSLNIG